MNPHATSNALTRCLGAVRAWHVIEPFLQYSNQSIMPLHPPLMK